MSKECFNDATKKLNGNKNRMRIAQLAGGTQANREQRRTQDHVGLWDAAWVAFKQFVIK